MSQSMTMMMPLMFGFFSLNFSTGLSFYFIISNIIGIITQGFISGWEGLLFWKGLSLRNLLAGGAKPAPAKQVSRDRTGQNQGNHEPEGNTEWKQETKKEEASSQAVRRSRRPSPMA